MVTAAAITGFIALDFLIALALGRALRWSSQRNERRETYLWHREMRAAGQLRKDA